MLDERERGDGIAHRHFEVLPLAGDRPVVERRHDAVRDGKPAYLIGDEGWRHVGRSHLTGERVGDAGGRLHDVVICGISGTR